jgi:hypothetical protein
LSNRQTRRIESVRAKGPTPNEDFALAKWDDVIWAQEQQKSKIRVRGLDFTVNGVPRNASSF